MKITLGPEQVVAIGPRYEDSYWGQFQFPKLHAGKGGKVLLCFHNGDDVWEELGTADLWFQTENQGESWEALTHASQIVRGVLLPSGDRLVPAARPAKALDMAKIKAPMRVAIQTIPSDDIWAPSTDTNLLPQPRGAYWDVFGQKHHVYHIADLPERLFERLNQWPMLRTKAGETEAKPEWATLHGWDTMGLHVSFSQDRKKGIPLMPQCLGNLKMGPDGKLWTAVYWNGLHPSGAFTPFTHVFVLYSEDEGRNWYLQGSVPYTPDPEEYENAYTCCGYAEPDFVFAPDGSMVMLLRTTDVFKGDKEWAPSYITRSTDMGKTWSKPTRYDNIGVLPGMCRLGDAILAIYGRPGIYVRATKDPAGLQWEAPVEVMTPNDRSTEMNEPPTRPNFHQWVGSCCNCTILPLDEHRAMIAYSDFYHPCEDGVRRKSIKTRIVTLEH